MQSLFSHLPFSKSNPKQIPVLSPAPTEDVKRLSLLFEYNKQFADIRKVLCCIKQVPVKVRVWSHMPSSFSESSGGSWSGQCANRTWAQFHMFSTLSLVSLIPFLAFCQEREFPSRVPTEEDALYIRWMVLMHFRLHGHQRQGQDLFLMPKVCRAIPNYHTG